MQWICNGCLCITFIFSLSYCYASNSIAVQQLEIHSQPTFDDLPQLLKKRQITVLVVNHPAYYFMSHSRPRGIAYDMMREYERHINSNVLKDSRLKLNIIYKPVASYDIITMLEQGLGDIAIGPLIPTSKDKSKVEFTSALYNKHRLVLVSNNVEKTVKSPSQLSGQEIWVRKDSIFHQKLRNMNKQIQALNKPPIYINLVGAEVEDFELLDMIDNQQISMTLISTHSIKLWKKIYKNIKLHPQLDLGEPVSSHWAIRKNTPQLASSLNRFIKYHKKGTKLGNILHKRYLVTHPWLNKILYKTFEQRYQTAARIIKKYAEQYGFDWQLILAQAYQESHLNQNAKSEKGAVGIMQVLPSTAREPYVNIPDLEHIDSNIHAGVKYLSFMRNRYFNTDEIKELDSILLTFAAYNAGPAKLRRLRNKTKTRGLNPNVWFNNVEKITAETIGKETVIYVNNIYKFYVTYLLASRYQLISQQPAITQRPIISQQPTVNDNLTVDSSSQL